jgi:hypothetical protein
MLGPSIKIYFIPLLNLYIRNREIDEKRSRYKAQCKLFDYQIMWFAVETHNNHIEGVSVFVFRWKISEC